MEVFNVFPAAEAAGPPGMSDGAPAPLLAEGALFMLALGEACAATMADALVGVEGGPVGEESVCLDEGADGPSFAEAQDGAMALSGEAEEAAIEGSGEVHDAAMALTGDANDVGLVAGIEVQEVGQGDAEPELESVLYALQEALVGMSSVALPSLEAAGPKEPAVTAANPQDQPQEMVTPGEGAVRAIESVLRSDPRNADTVSQHIALPSGESQGDRTESTTPFAMTSSPTRPEGAVEPAATAIPASPVSGGNVEAPELMIGRLDHEEVSNGPLPADGDELRPVPPGDAPSADPRSRVESAALRSVSGPETAQDARPAPTRHADTQDGPGDQGPSTTSTRPAASRVTPLAPPVDVGTERLSFTADVGESDGVPAQTTLRDVVENTVQGVRYLAQKHDKTLTVRLIPESLGELRLDVTSTDDVVHVRLISGNAAVRELLNGELRDLRELLVREGIDVGKMLVSTGAATNPDTGELPDRYPAHSVMAARNAPSASFADEPPAGGPATDMRRGAGHVGVLNVFV